MIKSLSKFALALAFLIESFVLLAETNWFFELFVHYAHYYAVIGTIFGVLALARRSFKSALLWITLVCMNLALFSSYLPILPPPTASDDSETVSILAQNLYYLNPNPEEFVDTAHNEAPDLIVIHEATSFWADGQDLLRSDYPYLHLTEKTGIHGILMGSKNPGTFTEIPLGSDVGLAFSPENGDYTVLAVHPMAPLSPSWAAERNAQFEAISTYTRSNEGPLVVIGDFNSTPWSPYLVKLLEETALTDARLGFGLVPTWQASSLLFHLPIDHALVSPEWTVLDFRTVLTKNSDHKGILVKLVRF